MIDPSQLLRRLDPVVRSVSISAEAVQGNAPLERQSFDELLTLVSSGQLSSGRSITISSKALLREELTDEQQIRLAAAADIAESAGADRAVMLIDGRGIILDVHQRTVIQELSSQTDRQAVLDIDAAVFVAGEHDERHPSAVTAPPNAGLLPGYIEDAIERGAALRRSARISQEQLNPPARRAG